MPRRDADWPTAAAFLPDDPSDLDRLREAAAGCRGCPLWEPATQTVFGRGGASARLVLVGEQPGDVEDTRGLPFVGPAGRELVAALDEAEVDRSDVYVTNAVKHFKFRAQGKRRIHASPDTLEVHACTPWLTAELAAVQPELVVLLGATAGKALLGPSFRVTADRGKLLEAPGGQQVLATLHPSAVLRADDRQAAHDGLVADLRIAAEVLRG
ncbi:MAG: uracil-DNA glycosylase [Frankiales bacterium]|nr:uracil-DNA glycosylase [Frankiales bacterium]